MEALPEQKKKRHRSRFIQSTKAVMFPFVDETLISESITPPSERGKIYLIQFFQMTWKMTMVSIFGALSTYFSFQGGLFINLRGNNLITVAVVFPVVFSINAAYSRREDALRSLAAIHGNLFALRLCYAHWNQGERNQAAIDALLQDADDIIDSIYDGIKSFLSEEDSEKRTGKLQTLLDEFSALSLMNERLRVEGKVAPPEISRVNEYVRVLLVQFETMRVIREYRTPLSLRCFTKFFIAIIPIVYGPVFSYIANESGDVWHGILLAVLFAIVLTALDNTQEALENPYDGFSPDDIKFRKPAVHMGRPVSRMDLSAILPHYEEHQQQMRQKQFELHQKQLRQQKMQQQQKPFDSMNFGEEKITSSCSSSSRLEKQRSAMLPVPQDIIAGDREEDMDHYHDQDEGLKGGSAEMSSALAAWETSVDFELQTMAASPVHSPR